MIPSRIPKHPLARFPKHLIATLAVLATVIASLAVPSGAVANAATHKARSATKSMFAATGFFRVAKKHGRWFLVSPQGDPFYASAVDTVSPVGDIDQTTGQCPYCQAVANDYPNQNAWATTTLSRLRSWGVNSLGSFSDTSLLGSQMPYTVQLNMGVNSTPDLFASSFATSVNQIAATQLPSVANDPNVIGIFTDTEPSWTPPNADGASNFGTLLDAYLSLPAGSPGLAVAQQYAGNPNGFLFAAATRYFQVTSAALKKYDPNHLNLGLKPEGQEIMPQMFEAAKPYVDVFSVEDYTYSFGLNEVIDSVWPQLVPITPNLDAFEKWADKPLMIGEYTALAAGPATPNTHPGIYNVSPDQQSRAAAYAQFIEPLYVDAPWMVGNLWFEYFDEPQGGRPGDNENDNFGLVNVEDQPYTALTNEMALMNSVAPDRVLQTGPVCDSWARVNGATNCTAYMPKVSYPLSIVDVSLPGGKFGNPYYFNSGIYAGGGKPPYKFSVSQGALPKGLKLNRKSGVIYGSPKAAGTFSFTVTVSDSQGAVVSQAGTITVSYTTAASVATTTLKKAQVGVPYNRTISSTGGTPPDTWSQTGGVLPPGLSLASTGTISGVPTTAGTYSFTVRVADSSNPVETATKTLSVKVK